MPHVTFIHGLSNKPRKDVLLKSWLRSLAGAFGGGLDLEAAGVTSGMVYWADVLYERPSEVDEEEPPEQEDERDVQELPATPTGLPPEEQEFVRSLEERLNTSLLGVTAERAAENATLPADRAIPLPKFVERRLMKRLVRDAHHYLYGSDFTPRPGETFQVKDELRKRFVEAIELGAGKPGPHVVVSHSMGTIIAYDCLRHDDGKVIADLRIRNKGRWRHAVREYLGRTEIRDRLKSLLRVG